MTREEAIKHLYELQFYCANEADSGENGCGIWQNDVDALDMAISALSERPQWISVEERLPDTYKNVLCCKDGDIRIGYYLGATYSKRVAAFRDLRSAFAFGATHWMPLPEPPKEEV